MVSDVPVIVHFAIHFHDGAFTLDGMFIHAFLLKFCSVKAVIDTGYGHYDSIQFFHITFEIIVVGNPGLEPGTIASLDKFRLFYQLN